MKIKREKDSGGGEGGDDPDVDNGDATVFVLRKSRVFIPKMTRANKDY